MIRKVGDVAKIHRESVVAPHVEPMFLTIDQVFFQLHQSSDGKTFIKFSHSHVASVTVYLFEIYKPVLLWQHVVLVDYSQSDFD